MKHVWELLHCLNMYDEVSSIIDETITSHHLYFLDQYSESQPCIFTQKILQGHLAWSLMQAELGWHVFDTYINKFDVLILDIIGQYFAQIFCSPVKITVCKNWWMYVCSEELLSGGVRDTFTGLHFQKAYTHSGTSCPWCVYQIWWCIYSFCQILLLSAHECMHLYCNSTWMRLPSIRIECLFAILRLNAYMHEQITEGIGIMNTCISRFGIRIGDRKYLNEYTPFINVSLWTQIQYSFRFLHRI